MENKVKKKIIISIIMVLLLGMIVVLNIVQVNTSETKTSKMITISEIEKMTDSKLADLFYNISIENKFVNETFKNYKCRYEVVANAEEALEKVKTIAQSDDTELLELKLVEETNYYYAIYQKYISYRSTENLTFENYYLFFKNSVLDINNNTINTHILNDITKIKEIFDLYNYTSTIENKGNKLLLSEIAENSNEYIYTCYYFDTSFGDFGLFDQISLCQDIITINKKSGKYEITENILREVKGKVNEEPYFININ